MTLHTLFVVVLCAYFPALSVLPYCESVHPGDDFRGIGPQMVFIAIFWWYDAVGGHKRRLENPASLPLPVSCCI